MYLMHIHRAFLFHKVLAVYNRKFGTLYSKHMVHVIYILHLVGGKDDYISFTKVLRTLQFCGVGRNSRNLDTLLLKAIETGLIMQDLGRNRRYWYKLTVEGINFLNYFELRLRKERWNR